MSEYVPTWCTCPATAKGIRHAVEVTPSCKRHDATKPGPKLDKVRKAPGTPSSLDARQLFWLQSYADGLSVSEIAQRMNLHQTSVRNIPRRIQVLWGTAVMTPAHLVAEAFRRGVIK